MWSPSIWLPLSETQDKILERLLTTPTRVRTVFWLCPPFDIPVIHREALGLSKRWNRRRRSPPHYHPHYYYCCYYYYDPITCRSFKFHWRTYVLGRSRLEIVDTWDVPSYVTLSFFYRCRCESFVKKRKLFSNEITGDLGVLKSSGVRDLPRGLLILWLCLYKSRLILVCFLQICFSIQEPSLLRFLQKVDVLTNSQFVFYSIKKQLPWQIV